jgi:cell division protein FtsW
MLLMLYGLLAYAGLRIARNASTRYAQLLAAGIISLYVGQAMLNIFTVLGLAPLTGVPLPFISYGGTTLVTMLVGIGLVLNVARGGELSVRAARPPGDARLSGADAAAEDRHRDRWDSRARRARADDRRRAAS